MREILFKAKRLDNGEWIEGDLVHSVYKINDICVGRYGSEIGMHQVDKTTICQYTGLTDKNGNKIWENDIVKVWWKQRTLEKDFEPKRYKAIVKFGNPNSFYSWGWQLYFTEDFPFNKEIYCCGSIWKKQVLSVKLSATYLITPN